MPFATLIFLIFYSASSLATEAIEPKPTQEAAASAQAHKNWLEYIYGKAPRDGIVFMPNGIHTQSEDKSLSANNLIGVVYDSFSLGTFINSYNDRTWYLVVIRNIFSAKGFGIDYFAGALHGYKGKLQQVDGIPFKNTFLYTQDVSPIVSVEAWYEVTNHIQIQATLTPLVLLGGVKYNF